MAEIISCPSCQRKLQIPEQFFGQMVQCPECQHRFVATPTSVSAQPIAPPREVPPSKARPRDDDSWDEDPVQRRSRYDDDYDDIGRHGLRRNYSAHRGGLIMALGLISLAGGLSFCLPVLLGPVAWAMGSYDMREIREGRMDPSGEGMTRAGQVCGILSTVILLLGGAFFGFMILAEMRHF